MSILDIGILACVAILGVAIFGIRRLNWGAEAPIGKPIGEPWMPSAGAMELYGVDAWFKDCDHWRIDGQEMTRKEACAIFSAAKLKADEERLNALYP